MANYKGSCACGQVNYSISDEPFFTQACHCKDCKKSTGSSFVVHSMIHADDLSIDGEIASTELPTGSGVPGHIGVVTKNTSGRGNITMESIHVEAPQQLLTVSDM